MNRYGTRMGVAGLAALLALASSAAAVPPKQQQQPQQQQQQFQQPAQQQQFQQPPQQRQQQQQQQFQQPPQQRQQQQFQQQAPPKLNNNNTPPKFNNNNAPPKLNNAPPKLNNAPPKLNNAPPKLNSNNTPPKLSNTPPKLSGNTTPPKLSGTTTPPKRNSKNTPPKLNTNNTPPKLSNTPPKLSGNTTPPKLSGNTTPPKTNGTGTKPNGAGTKPNTTGNGTKVNTKPTGTKPPVAPKPSATLKASQDKATAKQKDAAKAAQAAAEKAKKKDAVKPKPNGPGTTTGDFQKAKVKDKPVDKSKDKAGLAQAAKADPALAKAADKAANNKPMNKTDIGNLKNGLAKAQDPKAIAALHNATLGNAGTFGSVSDANIATLQKAAADPKTSPETRAALDAYLHGQPLSDYQQGLLNGVGGAAPPGSPLAVAIAKVNLDIANNKATENFNNNLLGLLGGGGGGAILPSGLLGGGGGFIPGGDGGDGGFILGGGGSFPPAMPVVYIPNDPSGGFDPDGVPDGHGLECAILPYVDPGLVDGGDNTDAVDLAASGLAQAADVLQQTRYLRVANDTDKPVTIFVQYQALNDQGDWVWSGEDDNALQFQLAPGEVTDLDDNGWRINAASAHIWVKSESGDEWNTFKDKELWLVPEQDENGNHVYQDQGIQVFDYAVR